MKLKTAVFAAGILLAGWVAGDEPMAFKPGELWLDNQGTAINAHGGGVLFHEGTYYWFGEHKIEGPAGNKAHVGVHVYASTDLLHWTDRGIALPVDADPDSEITRGCILERPKVIYNKQTGKFVMWFHLEHKDAKPNLYSTARSAVAVADEVTGPYTFVHSLRGTPGIWPQNLPAEKRNLFDTTDAGAVHTCFYEGQMSRDQTVFVDDDGAAYHFAASEHNATLHIRKLDATYTAYAGPYVRVFPGRYHEAPAVFKHDEKYYLIASGCSGWAPNAARSAVADAIMGPWTELDNPCEGVNPVNNCGPDKTFGGQSTFVLPVAGKKNAYIAQFDMWRPKNAIDGRYIWLPIQFNKKGFTIPWKSEWDLSVFNQQGASE